eukprot:940620-Amphidinium_carterae.1
MLLDNGCEFEAGTPCHAKFCGWPTFGGALVYHVLRQCECQGYFRVRIDLRTRYPSTYQVYVMKAADAAAPSPDYHPTAIHYRINSPNPKT